MASHGQTLQSALYNGEFVIVGVYESGFVIVYTLNCLLVFDQHAVHERVRLERLIYGGEIDDRWGTMSEADNRLIALMRGSIPTKSITAENLQSFQMDSNSKYPAISNFAIKPLSDTNINDECINNVNDTGIQGKRFNGAKSNEIADFVEAAKMRACKGAVKITERVAMADLHALLVDLGRCRNPGVCAHGRPTCASLYGRHVWQ